MLYYQSPDKTKVIVKHREINNYPTKNDAMRCLFFKDEMKSLQEYFINFIKEYNFTKKEKKEYEKNVTQFFTLFEDHSRRANSKIFQYKFQFTNYFKNQIIDSNQKKVVDELTKKTVFLDDKDLIFFDFDNFVYKIVNPSMSDLYENLNPDTNQMNEFLSYILLCESAKTIKILIDEINKSNYHLKENFKFIIKAHNQINIFGQSKLSENKLKLINMFKYSSLKLENVIDYLNNKLQNDCFNLNYKEIEKFNFSSLPVVLPENNKEYYVLYCSIGGMTGFVTKDYFYYNDMKFLGHDINNAFVFSDNLISFDYLKKIKELCKINKSIKISKINLKTEILKIDHAFNDETNMIQAMVEKNEILKNLNVEDKKEKNSIKKV